MSIFPCAVQKLLNYEKTVTYHKSLLRVGVQSIIVDGRWPLSSEAQTTENLNGIYRDVGWTWGGLFKHKNRLPFNKYL